MTMNAPTTVLPTEAEADSEFERVGRIVAVTGGHAIILLDATEFTSLGHMKNPEIGTLLKVDTPHTTALALVSALSAPAPTHEGTDQELRIAEVEFIGEGLGDSVILRAMETKDDVEVARIRRQSSS